MLRKFLLVDRILDWDLRPGFYSLACWQVTVGMPFHLLLPQFPYLQVSEYNHPSFIKHFEF